MFLLPLLGAVLPLPADSLQPLNVEEAVVVASPKETAQLRRQPLSASLFSAGHLQLRGVENVKDLAVLAPNFYMPDYGSSITSACYIRGIGSRMNTPAVGLYVDNVPYIDKSAYDFNFEGIDRVDVMRGPQGTLYGRNTMGGLVRIFTANPIAHEGTEVKAGWTSRTGGRRASFTTYLHPADRMGISLSGYYKGENGFFTNRCTGKKQDGKDAGGGRIRWTWNPTDVVKIDWTASYEYTDEDACPYFFLGNSDGTASTLPTEISQNRPSTYRRHLLNTGLGVEHNLGNMVLSSITAYQFLKDRLFMDQDFTAADIFSLEQQQRMHTVSEEIALRSNRPDRNWKWTTGLFAMYQDLQTDCPVTFYSDGVAYLNNQLAAGMPTSPAISLSFTGATLPFAAALKTPSANAAVFHQSTFDNLLVKGLSLTLGLRLDYDYRKLTLRSGAGGAVPFHFGMSMGPTMSFDADLAADPALGGSLSHDSWQVLPKGALSYALPSDWGNVYFSVAKGYRSGGYNIQSYSDLSQTMLRRMVMLAVKDFSVETINSIPYLPADKKQGAIQGMNAVLDRYTPAIPDLEALYYKPEYTWSYEFGTHLNLLGKALQLDLSTFYMKTRDQQLARFAASGMGRVMVNAGRSRSCGVEASLRSLLLQDRLQLAAAYGYTEAEFTNYNLGAPAEGAAVVDYTGNRVPFVPAHTFSASADFRQPLRHSFFRAFSVGADVRGAGSVMWDEANTFSQDCYAQLGARIGFELPAGVTVEAWGRNLTASRYATFSFDSMNHRFAQYGAPRHFGVDVKWKF